jgi:hypothetical protein
MEFRPSAVRGEPAVGSAADIYSVGEAALDVPVESALINSMTLFWLRSWRWGFVILDVESWRPPRRPNVRALLALLA